LKTLGYLALIGAMFAGLPAVASTICPSSASYIYSDGTATNVAGPLDGTCGADSAVQLTIPNDSVDGASIYFSNAQTGLTLGNVASIGASVAFSSDVASDEPYYVFDFHDTSGVFGETAGDKILFLENQSPNVSGSSMSLSPTATLFDVYDDTTGLYLNGGQSNVKTLDQLLAADPGLSSDPTYIGIAIGDDGGCAGPCSESLTVNSFTVNETAATPEPSSFLLLGTGLASLAGMARRRLGWA